MKSTDLRIGNIVHLCGKPSKVSPHLLIDLNYEETTGNTSLFDAETLSPVVLNDDWMAKLGFDIVDSDEGWVLYEKDHVEVERSSKGRFYFSYSDKEITYVHQLQNLYYGVIGIDIEINDNHLKSNNEKH